MPIQEKETIAGSELAQYALSPIQEGMLFHALHRPGHGFDIEQLVCSLPEDVDAGALAWAAEEVVRRHDVFRTSFHWDPAGGPFQVVHPEANAPFATHDLRGVPAEDRQQQVEHYLEEDRGAGFAMDRAPLTRFALFRLGEQQYTLVWTFHHTLLDGRSFPIILNDLLDIYRARRSGQPVRLPSPKPYREFIEWLQSRNTAQSEAFWRQALKGFTRATPLVSLDGAEAEAGYGEEEIRLSTETTAALRRVAEREGFTVNNAVQGAWALLLSRYSSSADVVFGAIRACRGTFPDAASMVGCFINTLPLRVPVGGDANLFPWLRQIRASQVALREHELTPLTSIQGWSEVPRGTPLFESILVFDNYLLNSHMQKQGGDWARREVYLRERTNFALSLYAYAESELIFHLAYDKQRFSAASVRQTLGHLRTLLEGMAEDKNQPLAELPLLTAAERRQILADWNKTETEYPREKCVHELIEEQARRTPDAPAVLFRESQLSYSQLNSQANQLARYLEQAGVKAGDRVGICLNRSLDLVVALVATLKTGAAYLPLDPTYPAERVKYVLSDAQVPVVVTQECLRERVAECGARIVVMDAEAERIRREDDSGLDRAVPSEAVAYMIYTSGSTGKPKGVMVSHRNVVNFFAGMDETIGRHGAGVWLAVTSISFDISVLELFWTLARGFRLVVQEENYEMRGAEAASAGEGYSIPEQVARHGVTHLQCTPSLARMLLDLPGGREAVGALELLLVGGEALPPAIAAELRSTGVKRIYNMYGPTETTIWSTMEQVGGASEPITIGRPIANTSLFVLDGFRQLVPAGVPGELYIGGDGVTPGYWNRPELTADRFVRLSFPKGERVYRTGDLVKYLPDGRVEYLGRVDHQVKIRGHRIELGEIEAALGQHPEVKEAVVTAANDRMGGKILVAHIVSRNGTAPPQADLRQFLAGNLPAYMVPSAFAYHASFPLTPNGKVDRGALAATEAIEVEATEPLSGPADAIEQKLVDLWEELLDRKPIGTRQNFFELGGHSLLIARLIYRIEREFGKSFSLATVFQSPTIESMAALLREGGAGPSKCKVFRIQPQGSRPPFICLGAGPFFLPLANGIGQDWPFCGLDLNPVAGEPLSVPYKLEEIAGYVKKAIREFQPRGPYFLGGWCLFGVLMYEAARQMIEEGDEVGLLVMIDSPNLVYEQGLAPLGKLTSRLQKLQFHVEEMCRADAKKIPAFLKHQMRIAGHELLWRRHRNTGVAAPVEAPLEQNFDHIFQVAARNYYPAPYSGRVVILQTTERPTGRHWNLANRWRHLIQGELAVLDVPAGHAEMFHEPHVQVLAAQMKECLLQAGA